MDFASMKRNRKESLNKLVAESEKQQAKSFEPDQRFWTPTTDDEGKGYAIIRFLPIPPGEEAPYAWYYQHNFQGPGSHWYNEKSLSTFKKKDPVGEFNRKLWGKGEEGQAQARKQKRQLKYVANILVLKDPAKPENEGGTFLYRFGPMIFEKIDKAIKPDFADETPFNPFDFWEGANFKLKIKSKKIQIGGRVVPIPNYEDSSFDVVSVLDEDDEKLEHIWKQCHLLNEFGAPESFKTYEELENRLNFVMEDVVSETSGDTEIETPPPASQNNHALSYDKEDDVDPLPEKAVETETEMEKVDEETETKKNYDRFRDLAN